MLFYILNGPNLNLLGLREPDIYGRQTYDDLLRFCTQICDREGITPHFFQSNHEGALVDEIQAAYGKADGIILNPAAYTHTSIAIADALRAVSLPAVEVHLSDISKRESYRSVSFSREACLTQFCGEGFQGYEKAIVYLRNAIQNIKKNEE